MFGTICPIALSQNVPKRLGQKVPLYRMNRYRTKDTEYIKETMNSFIKLPSDVLSCNTLSITEKVIYAYMLDRQNVFKHNHFESQDTIASSLCISRKTVHRALQKLIELGVVKARKEKNMMGGLDRWIYFDVVYPLPSLRAREKSRDVHMPKDVDDPFLPW